MEREHITGRFRMERMVKCPEKRLVFGWAYVTNQRDGSALRDHSGEIADIGEIERAAYRFVKLYRDGSDNHERGAVATLVESMVFSREKAEVLGLPPGLLPQGWWVGFEVSDEEVWGKIKSGEYAMFSIEGSARRTPLLKKRAGKGGEEVTDKLEDLIITRVAFVPEGDNKEANVLLYKSKEPSATAREKAGGGTPPGTEKGVVEVKIDRSKLTPGELALLMELEEKAGVPEEEDALPKREAESSRTARPAPEETAEATQTGVPPAVLAELTRLRGQVAAAERRELSARAKKYEILGKTSDELMPVLKSVKEADSDAFAQLLGILDASAAAVERSGIFDETGRRGGGEFDAWAAIERYAVSVQKAMPELSWNQAVEKACLQHPNLVHMYENERV